MKSTVDKDGVTVIVGDKILVKEIDSRITEYLEADEVESLNEFIGNVFEVNSINTDGSMVVTKSTVIEENGEIYGTDLGIFPIGAVKVS
ncbi:MAG: hypothetical protein ABJH06_15665 [Paraglaciecola sp.]|uniref:hypothetical protein n=1 Tax=Paraglaciecola sp. TaxID=1920173 RepID=UPI003298427B